MKRLHEALFFVLVLLLPTQLGKHFWPEWSYVLGLRIDYLSPTIYLTDLLVVGILGFWGLEKLKAQSSKFKTTSKNLKFFFFLFSIFVFLLIHSFFAQNPGAALYKLAKIVELAFLGVYVAKDKNSLFIIRNLLFIPIIYSSLIAVLQFARQASINGIFYWLGERSFNAGTPGIAKAIVGGRLIMRPYATLPHPNVLAGFVLASLVLISWGAKFHDRRSLRPAKWLAMGLGIGVIIISFSRSVWVVGLLVGLCFLLKRFRSGVASAVCFGGGALVVILAALLLFKLPFSTSEAFSQRLQLIKVATLMIQSAPLTGVGLNNFIVRLPEFWQTPETIRFLQPAHNIFLLIAAETGLIGLAIFLWLLILTYKRLFTNHYSLITSLTVILLLGLFDHYWLTLQQTQILFAIVLGLSWKTTRSQEERKG